MAARVDTNIALTQTKHCEASVTHSIITSGVCLVFVRGRENRQRCSGSSCCTQEVNLLNIAVACGSSEG